KGDEDRCRRAGMDAYIPKPMNSHELLVAMAALARDLPAGPTPQPASYGELIDAEAILRRVEGDKEWLRETVELFLEECQKRLNDLRAAASSDNCKAFEFAAHALKGSIQNFCAHRATLAAAKLEALGRSGNLTGADEACAELEREIEALKPALCS